MNEWLIKPSYTSTNPENSVKIDLVYSENARLEDKPLKY